MLSKKRGKIPSSQIFAKNRQPPKIEKNISISLQYLSKNKQRNFEFFFDKNLRQKAQALNDFVNFAKRLTSKTRLDIASKRKFEDCGFENLRFQDVNCTPDGYELSKDANISVFRFGDNFNGGDYRILGFFSEDNPVFNIIGFDFDYSAYKHD